MLNRGFDMKDILVCPECNSDMVVTEHHQAFWVNTGEHYCHSVKTYDADSPSRCLDCGWEGVRRQLLDGGVRE